MKIALSVVLAILFVGCSDDTTARKSVVKQTTAAPVTKEAVVPEKQTVSAPIKVEKKIIKKELEVRTAPPALEGKKITKKATDNVMSSMEKPADGAKLFTKCVACHGAKAEKNALNKSQIIQGWSSDKIITAINGYKAGTYGSSMKSVMQSQVGNLSDNEVKALANYISKIK